MIPTIDATDELTDAAAFEALALVDTALRMVAQREVFTRDEALQMPRDVRAGIHDTTVGAILDGVLAACEHDLLIRRSRLLDPLLDIRLALVAGSVPATRASQPEGIRR